VDVTVVVGTDGQAAQAHLTAKANLPGESMPQVQELKIGFRKIEREWLIDRVQTVRTLH